MAHHLTTATDDQQPKQLAPTPPMEIINPSGIHKPALSYSHVARIPISDTSTLVTISGQIGMAPGGTIPPAFADQVHLALRNLGACLSSAGCGPNDIVKVTHYVVGLGNKDHGKVRSELFAQFLQGREPPPSTLIGVAALALPGLLYEIEALAVCRSG